MQNGVVKIRWRVMFVLYALAVFLYGTRVREAFGTFLAGSLVLMWSVDLKRELQRVYGRPVSKWARKLLCATFGHPPVVEHCLGYASCARCNETVGDALGGAYSFKGVAIVGHQCNDCTSIIEALTFRQRVLTRLVP